VQFARAAAHIAKAACVMSTPVLFATTIHYYYLFCSAVRDLGDHLQSLWQCQGSLAMRTEAVLRSLSTALFVFVDECSLIPTSVFNRMEKLKQTSCLRRNHSQSNGASITAHLPFLLGVAPSCSATNVNLI
jgi:hypothetical protein